MSLQLQKAESGLRKLIDGILGRFSAIHIFPQKESKEPRQVVLKSKDVRLMDTNVQSYIGKLHAKVTKLESEKEELIERLYEDRFLNIKKDMHKQLSRTAHEILLEGELHHMRGFPTAISYGSENKIMGKLLCVARYNNMWYPVLWKSDGIRVIIQPADSYEDVIRSMTEKFVILGYDINGKYVPKVYQQT